MMSVEGEVTRVGAEVRLEVIETVKVGSRANPVVRSSVRERSARAVEKELPGRVQACPRMW